MCAQQDTFQDSERVKMRQNSNGMMRSRGERGEYALLRTCCLMMITPEAGVAVIEPLQSASSICYFFPACFVAYLLNFCSI